MKILRYCLPLLLLAISCEQKQPAISEEIDTPTKGKIKVSIDENIRPLADQLIDAFEYSYPDAFLVQSYAPESNAVQELVDDTTRLAILTRMLTRDEMNYFEGKKFGIEHIKIGSDAVVFLVNRENPDSLFTVDEIRRMMMGNDSLWAQIRPKSTLGHIQFVFDNNTSSNLRFLSDTLLGGKVPGRNCFAVKSSDTVVAYVNAHPNAIGVVGLNWLGDKESEADRARRSQVRMAAIGKDSTSCVHPDQSALITGIYPFTRGIWIVKIGRRAGLGTGFATFALSDRGQLIVQHSGLAPAAPAERRVEINNH